MNVAPVDDERKLFEYFIVAGLDNNAEELATISHECGNKAHDALAPITDICVIFPSLGETVPKGYECINHTPSGHPADLNHGSLTTSSVFLCFKRGYHKPPLVDIGVLDESKQEKVKIDSVVVEKTPFGNSANVNNASSNLFFTARRSKVDAPPHQLVITNICVILPNKNESPPHTYYKIDKNLNKAMVGSDVYVCYKKSASSSKRISYKASVLDCYPKVEDLSSSIVKNVPMFCLPMGAVIECWSKRCGEPDKVFSTCVLTDEMGTKYYGASLTFYEKYTPELTKEQLEKLEPESLVPEDVAEEEDASTEFITNEVGYYCNKAICIVSRYPFFEPFRCFLYFLNGVSSTSGHRLPIERYISHLMLEVPFPAPSRPRVLVQLCEEMISFESHDDSQMPLSGSTFTETLKFLGVESMIYAMLLALLEQKILVHSLRPWLLTAVSETLCAMMFPFHWVCPYIPQCPLNLAGVLHAPLPFIAGVHSMYFDLYEDPPSDVTCFDLDTGVVSHSAARKKLKLSLFPKKPLKRLRLGLEKIFVDIQKKDGTADQRRTRELSIREEFLRFMCALMRGYSDYLTPVTSRAANATTPAKDISLLFDLAAFVRSRDPNAQDFYKRFSGTQCFIRFIEERSFVSDKNVYNVFFDDCIRRMDALGAFGSSSSSSNNSVIQLLDHDAYIANHTKVIPQPEGKTNNVKIFNYAGFPTRFDHELFETAEIENRQKAAVPTSPTAVDGAFEFTPIPFALTRCKQEVRTSMEEVRRCAEESQMWWPRSVLFYAYSLWFLQLPSLVYVSRNKLKMLKLAFRILTRMEKTGVPMHDQLPYRILIHLCGENHCHQMAVDALRKMRRYGIEPNAITYGLYHQVVMYGQWPPEARQKAAKMWRRVRLLFEGMYAFKRGAQLPSQMPKSGSRTSLQSSAVSTSGSLSATGANASSDSPSIMSFMSSVKSKAVKGLTSRLPNGRSVFKGGYDEVVQQSAHMFKKMGLNTLINEMKSLKPSDSVSRISSSDEALDDPYDPRWSDPIFQLDSGTAGDLLPNEYWMSDVLPRSVEDPNLLCPVNAGLLCPLMPLDVTMCSSTLCPNCQTIVYDEELMAGWSPDDASNLNSTCPLCSHHFAPLLKIHMRKRPLEEFASSWYHPFVIAFSGEIQKAEWSEEDPAMPDTQISVPYVSPLSLRRELETLLLNDPLILTKSSLRSSHPIIFWNLLYYFRRLDAPAHIYGWIAPQVHIRCVYDIPTQHSPSLTPLYLCSPAEKRIPRFSHRSLSHGLVVRETTKNLYFILRSQFQLLYSCM